MKQKLRYLFSLCLVAMATIVMQAQGYKDVTDQYIQNADQSAAAGWTYTRQTTGGVTKTWSGINKLYSGSYDSEIFAGNPQGYTTFSAYQAITLPKGTYHLIGKAFKRDVPSVIFYAEIEGQKTSVEVCSVNNQYAAAPASMDAAAKAFNANMYLNDLEFTVEADNTPVTIGYSGEFTAASQWFIMGAMNLYQVQDEVSTTYPKDITPSLNRSNKAFSGLTGRYANADKYIHEKYAGSSFAAGDLVYQTFTGLENGIYEVVINANASKANGVGSLPASNPYVYAGSVQATVTAVEQSSVTTVGEYTLKNVSVTDGTMRVGFYNTSAGGNWWLFNVKSVKYCGGSSDLANVYSDLLAEARTFVSKPMEASVKTALNAAITAAETNVDTTNQAWLESTISALTAAINDAKASNSLYTGAILDAVNGMKAQSTSDAVKTDVQQHYDDGGYATAADVYTYYQPLEIAALSRNANTSYTSAIINPGFELGNTDGWTIERSGSDTGARSTTSTTYEFSDSEGSYLFNNWSPNVQTLDIGQTITGLPNGYYTVSAVVAGFGDSTPITMTAGNKSASINPTNDDVRAETKVGHALTVERVFVTDGTLTFKLFNTGKGETLLKCDNFQLTLTEPYTGLDSYTDLALNLNIENDEVARYLANTTYTEASTSVIGNYATAAELRNDQPASVSIPLPAQAATTTLSLSLNSDYSNAQTYTVDAGSIIYDVTNLLPSRTYYYKVEDNNSTIIASGTITTTGQLRMIKADGIANMRDLGGWTNAEGNHIRYGKIFRGTELAGGKSYTASAQDLTILKNELNIGAEVDLRQNSDFASGTMSTSAIDGASYYYANMSRFGIDALISDADRFKNAFDLVLAALKADKAAYFHCIFGADRTGCFAFLLEGLLGLPIDQIAKDYELTSFSSAGKRQLNDNHAVLDKWSYINALPGDNLQQRFYNYWRGVVGISESDLNDFINLMVDGTSAITTATLADLPAKVVEDGEYYIYLPSMNKFLGRGLTAGTRAVPDNYGVPAQVSTNGVGVTTVQYLDNSLYLGSDGYADKAAAYKSVSWMIEQRDDAYVLKSHNGYYLSIYNDANGIRARVEAATAADATPVAFKTAAEQKALVASAQQANILAAASATGITASDLAAFNTQLSADYTATPSTATINSATTGSKTDWVLSEPYAHGESGNAYNVGNYGGELYMKNGVVSQTVTVPHAGLYKLTLNAFYRQGTNDNCYALGQRGFDNLSNAYVSVNDTYYAQIPSWYSDCAADNNPNSTAQANTLMDEGKYQVEVYAYIDDSKSATIAVNVPSFIARGWCIFNNFALTEYTKTVTIAESDTQAPELCDYANVTLTRTLKGGQWNGFSVPFSFTIAGSALEGAEVKQFSSAVDNEISLTDATEIVAGKPYLVKPDADIVNPTFNGVAVENPEEMVEGTGDYKFAAHLYHTPLATDGSIAYVSTKDSSVKRLTSGSIKGLRSIFQIPVNAPAGQGRELVIRFGDDVNAILSVDADGTLIEGAVYNLCGQRMQQVQRGVNILNGKKIVVE